MNVFSALFHNFFGYSLQIIASLERGKFYEHREVDSGNDFNLVIIYETKTEIRRRSPKHVSEDKNTILLVNSLQALTNFFLRFFHIIIPSNRNGINIDHFSKDNIQGIQKLLSQFAVRNDDPANHFFSLSTYFNILPPSP